MTLATKIAAASRAVGGRLATDKQNKEQGYPYVSADAILGFGGQALAEQDVIIFPAVVDFAVDQFVTVSNKTRYDARVTLALSVTDGAETQAFQWMGLGSDYTTPDKAYYKAITSGHRYFLAKLLCIGAFNEDGEHENGESEPGAASRIMETAPKCPKCNGPMWDNRERKRSPKAPDYKCKNKACDGAIWINATPPQTQPAQAEPTPQAPPQLPDGVRKALNAAGKAFYGSAWDTKRHELVRAITKGRTQSSADLTVDEATRLINGIHRAADKAAAEAVQAPESDEPF